MWHGYVKEAHRAKVIYALEELDMMLKVLSGNFNKGGFLNEGMA